VLFLFFCVGGALIFHLFALLEHEKKVPLSHSFFFALMLFFLWTLIALFLNQDINPYFASGNPEKRHGWYFYGTLFFLFFLLRTFSAKKREQLLFMSFFGFFGVVLYAFFQRFGLDPLSGSYQTRLDSTRIFATLGNPNYLA